MSSSRPGLLAYGPSVPRAFPPEVPGSGENSRRHRSRSQRRGRAGIAPASLRPRRFAKRFRSMGTGKGLLRSSDYHEGVPVASQPQSRKQERVASIGIEEENCWSKEFIDKDQVVSARTRAHFARIQYPRNRGRQSAFCPQDDCKVL
jgi:hypothetical protein